ncbi:hypothetical protein PI125_g18071 [Phytophthora idaei]|nr:hypothetical protein PI125_g18071 [Phytophthora idaei]
MTTQVKEKEDFVWINDQCMVLHFLHNFALVHDDEEQYDDDRPDEPDVDDITTPEAATTSGQALRENVKSAMLNVN